MKRHPEIPIILLLVLFMITFDTFAGETFFSIQTGAFHHLKNAKKQFNMLKRKLDPLDSNLLRIERSGKFYFVRVGKFYSLKRARGLFKKIKFHIKDAQIVKTRGAREIIDVIVTQKEPINDVLGEINSLLSEGRYKRAREVIKDAFKRFGEDDRLYALLGAVNLKMAEYEKAFRNFSRAIAINDKRAEYYNGAGYSLLFSNRPSEALLDFEKALKLKPNYSDALAGTAYAYLALGLKDEAMNVYYRLKKIDKGAATEVFKALLRTN